MSIITPEKNYLTDSNKEAENKLIISYLMLRNLIGLIGMSMPFVFILFAKRVAGEAPILHSISHYYYTNTGEVLVILHTSLGLLLITYRGYRFMENLLTTIAGFAEILIAFFPVTVTYPLNPFSVHTAMVCASQSSSLHIIFSSIFLGCVTIIDLVYFTKTDETSLHKPNGKLTQKAKRNRVYKICGWIMVASLIVIVLYEAVPCIKRWVGRFPLTFWGETVALEAFGVAWITKGEGLWPDGKHYIITFLKQIKRFIY